MVYAATEKSVKNDINISERSDNICKTPVKVDKCFCDVRIEHIHYSKLTVCVREDNINAPATGCLMSSLMVLPNGPSH